MEQQKEEEEKRRWREREDREFGEGRKVGQGWEEMMETVKNALHLNPLSEEEYLALRGRHDEGTGLESHKQSLIDYIHVSQLRVYTGTRHITIHIVCV